MNRFEQLIEELRQRAEADGQIVDGKPQTKASAVGAGSFKSSGNADVVEVQDVRMPYSSEPDPVGEPWHSN